MRVLIFAVSAVGCGGSSDNPSDGSTGGDAPPAADAPTNDRKPPEIASVDPFDDAEDRPLNQTVTVTFSEPIDPATANATSIHMFVGPTDIAGTVSVDGASATFTPSATLAIDTKFSLKVEATIADLAGNKLVADSTFRFTTVHRRRVFVTSITNTGRLASWPGAGTKVGLAAGDAACQVRATAAGLDGTFVAWLSDGTNDAYCRVQGLGGKRVNNCNQASLPIAAGPWVRVDGTPWADTIDQLTAANKVFSPPILTELNTLAPTNFHSNTAPDGSLNTVPAANSCSNWTSTIGNMTYGGSRTTGTFWTIWGNELCSSFSALLCIELGQPGLALPFPTPAGKKAFVTSTSHAANLGADADANGQVGILAGDAICQARATAASLTNPTAFKAWLSDTTINASTRLTSTGPWSRIDGIPIATNLTDLLDGRLGTTLDQTETGAYVAGAQVWTSTLSTGLGNVGGNCADWTAGAGTLGTVGRANNSDSHWTRDAVTVDCAEPQRLYCFED
jgi:hypothetical protein